MDNLTQTGVIRDELVRLIKVANPEGPNWAPTELSIEYKSYDSQTDNNTIWVRDLTNRFFSYRDFEYHRVEFSLLFKGITPMVQVREGETVAAVLKRFCIQYGLPQYLATDFEDSSLFTQTVHLIDGRGNLTAIFADDSLGWHGILDIGLWDGVPHLNTAIKTTDLDGFTPPNNDLSEAIIYPTLAGYRYPSLPDDEQPE
jgi:hypothetical protein